MNMIAVLSVLWAVAVKSYFAHLVAVLISGLLLTDLAGYIVKKSERG